MSENNEDTWVYLIEDHSTGLFKIGRSDDPKKRLKELKRQRTLLPSEHSFYLRDAWYCSKQDETELHLMFAAKRVRGEWFQLDARDFVEFRRFMYDKVSFIEGYSAEEANYGLPFNPFNKYKHKLNIRAIENAMNLDALVEGFGVDIYE